MALNADSLKDEILSALQEDDTLGITPNEKSKIVWKAISKAIITHITNNAVVTGNAPPQGGPITLGKIT